MPRDERIAPHIFKSYDIRGIVDEELTEAAAEQIGTAVVMAMPAKKLAVGRDMRSHSPRLEASLIRGITRAGADVVRIGQCSTPMSYFAAATLGVDGAVMVTASHNPSHYNGFKLSKRGGEPMGQGTGLEKVQELVLSGKAAAAQHALRVGTVEETDLLAAWCRHLKQYVPEVPKLKIVLDCGNSVMGPILKELLAHVDAAKRLETIWLFDEPDGTFPWHPADPLNLVNLQHLQGAVLATKADFGVAFDGDGDRLAFVDENAHFVGCDLMTALFAQKLLSKPGNRGKLVFYDLRSSLAVREAISAAGGVPEMCRVGHSHVKAAMRGLREGRLRHGDLKGEALFAGELSGHFFFADCFTIDTSERAFLLALELFASDPRSLGERVAPLRKFWHSGEINYRLPSQPEMQKVLSRVEEQYAGEPMFKLDGVLVESQRRWFNVRLSNTEPVIRVTAESLVSREDLQSLLREIEALITQCGGSRAK